MMQEKLRKRALVVDDEALIRWSVAECLAEAGWQVRQAATGAEALDAAGAWAGVPYLILLDLRLPDVADLSLVQTLHTRRPDVPIVVMTAYGSAEERRSVHALGVIRVIDKPFDIRTIVSCMDEAYTAARWPEDES
jgi:DNA-binding NtrC family response regulator